MKLSYFSNYFIICLQSIFSFVETVFCLSNINCIIFVLVISHAKKHACNMHVTTNYMHVM